MPSCVFLKPGSISSLNTDALAIPPLQAKSRDEVRRGAARDLGLGLNFAREVVVPFFVLVSFGFLLCSKLERRGGGEMGGGRGDSYVAAPIGILTSMWRVCRQSVEERFKVSVGEEEIVLGDTCGDSGGKSSESLFSFDLE